MAQAAIVNVITQPTIEPISLVEAKLQIRRRPSFTAEDEYISFLIMAARTGIENRLGVSFHEQRIRWTLDAWPGNNVLELPRATPLIELEEITYRDFDGTTTVWPSSEYDVDTYGRPGRVAPKPGAFFPVVILSQMAAINLVYRAGIEDDASPPVEIPGNNKMAILMLLGHLYQNRESVSIGTLMEGKEMPHGVEFLLSGQVYAF